MKTLLHSPARLFLILALAFGVIWIFLMPAGAGYDEETHLARIFEIGHGYLIPNQWLGVTGNGIPQSMLQVSYRQQQFLQPLTKEDIQEGLQLGITGADWIAHQTRATYSPLLYLPQAILLVVFGYLLKAPILVLYWILRLTYLLSYIAAAYFAIRLMPKFKWTLFVLALAPSAMIQAVSISADPMTNGLSFLFVAWALSLVEGKKTIDWKTFWVTILLAFLLFSVKPNSTPLVLLLVLLKPDQFPSRKRIVLFWGILAALFIVEVGGWTAIQLQAEAAWHNYSTSGGTGFLSTLLADPLKFAGGFVDYMRTTLPHVLSEYTASFGYGYYAMPVAVYALFWVSLAAAILHDWQLDAISKASRILLAIEFVVLFFGTFAQRYILKLEVQDPILSQGRYFIPFVPLLFFSIFGGQIRLKGNRKWLNLAAWLGSFLTLLIVTAAIYLVYYVPCGMYRFTPGQCVIPVYKNWDPTPQNSVPVSSTSVIEQTFQPDCGKIADLRIFTYLAANDAPDEKLTLRIQKVDSAQPVVDTTIPLSEVANGGMTIIPFDVFNADTNAKYSILLSTSSPNAAIQLALSDRQRIRGELTRNGTAVDKDLLFQYQCAK